MNKELKGMLAECTPAEITKVMAHCKALRMEKRAEAKSQRDELKAQLEALKERRKSAGAGDEGEERPRKKKKGKKNRGE